MSARFRSSGSWRGSVDVPTFWAAWGVSLVGTGLAWQLLTQRHVFDVPNARSSHVEPVVRGGGLGPLVAVVIVVGASLVGARSSGLTQAWISLGGLIAMAGLGLADDVRGLSASVRLASQLVVGACVSFAVSLSSAIGRLDALLMGVVAAVWVAAYTNAFNFMDGINAISAVTAVIAGAWFAWLARDTDGFAFVSGLALAGAALGFLPWNAYRPKVFLGDVGSYGVGALVAIDALLLVRAGVSPLDVVGPLAIYLADTMWTLLRRVVRGEHPAQAHREHVYQRLVDGGSSHLAIALLVGALALAMCAVAATCSRIVTLSVIVLVVGTYLSLPRWQRRRPGDL